MHVPEDKTKRKMKFAGIPIDVQFDTGDRRHYPAANGFPEYNVTMKAIYGEVPGTKGTDGDPVDVYIGKDASSTKVFIIRQMKFPKYEAFDEEKCMLGFGSADDAQRIYLKHHQNKKIFGGIKELSMEQFKDKLATKGREGKKLAALGELLFAAAQRGVPVDVAKLASAIYDNRAKGGVLGTNPDTAEIPATTTDLNAALSDATKVAVLKTLKNLVNRGAALSAHPAVHSALTSAAPDDGLIELAKPGLKKALEGAKKLVKSAALETPLRASCGDEYAHKLEKLKARHNGTDAAPGQRTKKADAGRAHRIAERVDDVGIGMLATPYAAEGVGKLLAHRSGRLGAIGRGAQAVGHALHEGPHKNKWELGGLALVAPGVTNRIAGGIDKAVPGKKPAMPVKTAALEEFARSIKPDFEYLTEPEKLAYLGAIRAMVPAAKAMVGRGVQAARGAVGTAMANPNTASTLTGAQAAGKKVLSAGNVAKAGVLAAGAVGAVGAYKGVKGMANFLGHEHKNPVASPQYEAPRVF